MPSYLKIDDDLTLKQLSSIVGSDNVGEILNVNSLTRQKNIGSQLSELCESIISSDSNVSTQRKLELLNNASTDSDVFEYTSLQDEDSWKVLSNISTFPGMLQIPDTVEITLYDDILGNGIAVSSTVYEFVMSTLQLQNKIDTSIFNDYSTIKKVDALNSIKTLTTSGDTIFSMFNVPWGDITFYSQLTDESIDIPVYPEKIEDPRTASYSTMPDTLYQYEPWYTYSNSGPRDISFEFHMHRQMWTGDETDGKANELIRFIQSATYAQYDGSSVVTDICTLYIKGSPLIQGIVTSVDVEWSGPIGSDGFYLEFTLTLQMTEISDIELNLDSVRNLSLIGG